MAGSPRIITVFGGSGFIGRHVVKRLAKQGFHVRVVCRNPLLAGRVFPMGDPGQIVAMRCNVLNEAQIAEAVRGVWGVINLVGILYQSGSQRFEALQGEAAGAIARAAKAAGVLRIAHMSAIGADAASDSLYARSKAHGEAGMREAFPDAAILRPSIVFGSEDGFFNRFGALAARLPVLPLFGGGETRMQPVYVGDVAEAAVHALTDEAAKGATFELGGPRVYTFRELMDYVRRVTGRRPLLLPLPFWFGHVGAFLAEWLPAPPLTRDQLRLLAKDNVVSEGARTLRDLGIAPMPVEAVAPSYLYVYRKAGQFTDLREG
jgi:NADH dehydrogenase